jgi:hypothetical protein
MDAFHTDPQTVGSIADAMLNFYLKEAGYYYGVNDPRGLPGWEHYWNAHQARTYSFSWVRLLRNRATGGISPLQPGARVRLQQLGQRIAKLPAPDRELYLLWLNAGEQEHRFATDAELLDAARRLSHNQRVAIVTGMPPSTDPDLLAQSCGDWVYRRVVDFLLTHASELFQSEDQALLAELPARERKQAEKSTPGFQSSAVVTPFYAIGRARLAHGQASAILRAAFADFSSDYQRPDQAHLAGALWQLRPDAEAPFLSDWFLRQNAATTSYGTEAQRVFLSYLSPKDSAFADLLLDHPRSANLKGEAIVAFRE